MKKTKIRSVSILLLLLMVFAVGCSNKKGGNDTESNTSADIIITEEIIKSPTNSDTQSEKEESTVQSKAPVYSKTEENKSLRQPSSNSSASSGNSSIDRSENDKTEDNQMNNRKLIAFTFDDGPNDAVTAICDKFEKYDGKATFMVIGRQVNGKNIEYLKYAVDKGFEIGNHTMTHTGFTTLSRSEMIKEISQCDNAVEKATGYKMTLVRLPGLSGNETVYSAMRDIGKPMIGGDMTNDWAGTNISVEELASYMIKHAEPGKVMLMHSLQRGTDALEIILPELKSQGYEFVTVTDMFKISGKRLPLGYQITRVQ